MSTPNSAGKGEILLHITPLVVNGGRVIKDSPQINVLSSSGAIKQAFAELYFPGNPDKVRIAYVDSKLEKTVTVETLQLVNRSSIKIVLEEEESSEKPSPAPKTSPAQQAPVDPEQAWQEVIREIEKD